MGCTRMCESISKCVKFRKIVVGDKFTLGVRGEKFERSDFDFRRWDDSTFANDF